MRYDSAINTANNIFEIKLIGFGTIFAMSAFIIGRMNIKEQNQMLANINTELSVMNSKLSLQNFSMINFPDAIPMNTDKLKCINSPT